ncbi:MAG: hypothetical protein LH468_13590 [Nocardioides sp.]|nr:hypothetical protein [Nocardioides sp.]
MGVSMVVLGSAGSPANAASALVTIDVPNAPAAGTVSLTGKVGVGAGDVTSVLYVMDATGATASPAGADCSGNGALGAEDDLNSDGSLGDVLDCEIAGVNSLNNSLAASSRVQVGLVAFGAAKALAADVDPSEGTTTFVPPGFTGGDPQPRIGTVARSVVQNQIRRYEPKDLSGSGSGTAFTSAIGVALSTLASAPPGPKMIMFLSDGQSGIDRAVLEQLSQSGARLRSFGIGADASCGRFGSLYKMAAATGESCALVPDPASLATELITSQPDAVNGVTVSIRDVSLAATLDAVGGWRVNFTLGAGTYTATARAVLASGATSSAQQSFTVAPSAGGPAAGTVGAGPGSLNATVVTVKRPDPSRAALPARVAGRVGPVGGKAKVTPKLAGARVLLQARSAEGAPWTTVDRSKVTRAGTFALAWKPKTRFTLLRVVLAPHRGFAGSASAVPAAKISSCKVLKRGGGGFSVSCLTTAKTGSRVSLLKGRTVVDRARVRKGGFRVDGNGPAGAHRIDILAGKRHLRLDL